MVAALLGRTRKRSPKKVVLVGSPSKGFSRVFVRGRKPSQIISTLEAFAVLLSLKLFAAHQPEGQRRRMTILLTWTVNWGNGSVLQADDYTPPLVRARRGACCRDEEKPSQGAGRLDTEVLQP